MVVVGADNAGDINVLDVGFQLCRKAQIPVAVSYTHLDVYKRQQKRSLLRQLYLPAVLCTALWGSAAPCVCLLYTSLLIVGMALFSLGTDVSMTHMGEGIGAQLPSTKNLFIVILITLIIGVLITIAEPDPVSYTHLDVYKRQGDRWCMVVVSSCREMLG